MMFVWVLRNFSKEKKSVLISYSRMERLQTHDDRRIEEEESSSPTRLCTGPVLLRCARIPRPEDEMDRLDIKLYVYSSLP